MPTELEKLRIAMMGGFYWISIWISYFYFISKRLL